MKEMAMAMTMTMTGKSTLAAFVVASLCAVAPQAAAQDAAALAQNPKLFLDVATKAMKWNEAAEPVKIAGPIYFVGTTGLSAWLIRSSEGLILLNTALPPATPMIEAAIRKLGFRPEDVKLLLDAHAHIDHVGGHAHFKRSYGAKVVMMDVDAELARTGGKADFHYAAVPEFGFEPVAADIVIRDGDVVKLGDVALTARLTPGHTKGSTTWIMNVVDGGKNYTVVFPDGSGVNPGFRLVKNPSYPGIADDYRRTLHILETQKPDIWLASHTADMGFDAKRARAAQVGVQAWVDPEGYRQFVASQREKFEAVVNAEMGIPPKAK
jgi:metallo-beta-lactamase class B